MVDKRNLYIFVTSNIPDVYINTIGYCIENYDINEIILLGIVKDKGQKSGSDKYLSSVKSQIEKQLILLQKDKYLYKDQDTKEWKEKQITIESHHKARYIKISEYKIDTYTILYRSEEHTSELQSH